MKKYKFLFFTLLLAFLFFPKDTFALEISNVQFYNNGSLVHTFNKNEIQGQYASINPIEVDAMHINYSDVTQKNSYNYQFQGNFDMAGNRVFDSIRAFNINNGVTQQPSTSNWVLYSVEVAEPFYNGNYNISADWTSINDSNVLSLQFDLGGNMILSAFRLNTSRLLNDGEDVGDSITNQTQEIIQNQDKNQQQTNEKLDEVKEAIKDSFTNCRVGKNLFNKNIDPTLHMYVDTTNNVFVDNYASTYSTYIFLPIEGGNTYTISKLPGKTFRVATSADVPRSGVSVLSTIANHTAGSITITTPNNAKYLFVNYYNSDNGDTAGEQTMRNSLQIEKGSIATSYEPYEFVCKNRIDETNEKLDKLEQSITNEDGPNLNGLDNSAGWLPAGPVDSILNLPFSFFENLTDNLSKTCQPVAMTFPFTNTNFQLPCISTLYEKIGILDFLNWLGVVVGAIILYRYFLSLYKWVDDTLTFRENNHNDWGGV